MNFDRDRSGTVEPQELQQALVSFGYNLSPQAMGVLLRRYSNNSRVSFDQFVALCVRLRALTGKFYSLYRTSKGQIRTPFNKGQNFLSPMVATMERLHCISVKYIHFL